MVKKTRTRGGGYASAEGLTSGLAYTSVVVVKCSDEGLTGVVTSGDAGAMKAKKERARKMKAESSAPSVRATITFPSELHATLERIARQKKVSLAWVVREAVEQYLADKWPLLQGQA